jgi:hypothetical protein
MQRLTKLKPRIAGVGGPSFLDMQLAHRGMQPVWIRKCPYINLWMVKLVL